MPDDHAPAATTVIYASPLRRMGAMFYDGLLCAAVLMIAGLVFVPFNGADHKLHGAVLYAQRAWLLIVLVMFFCYFWTQKACTLGMKSWGLIIESSNGDKPSLSQSLSRFMSACLPWLPGYALLSIESALPNPTLRLVGLLLLLLVCLNYLAGYLDPQRRALHDRLLGTSIVHRG